MSLLQEHGTLLPSELAELERVSAQAISQIIQRLFADGCIAKTTDKTDKRKIKISLTDKGHLILDEIWDHRNRWLVEAQNTLFDKSEIQTLSDSLPYPIATQINPDLR